jgi:hypothetical protein
LGAGKLASEPKAPTNVFKGFCTHPPFEQKALFKTAAPFWGLGSGAEKIAFGPDGPKGQKSSPRAAPKPTPKPVPKGRPSPRRNPVVQKVRKVGCWEP